MSHAPFLTTDVAPIRNRGATNCPGRGQVVDFCQVRPKVLDRKPLSMRLLAGTAPDLPVAGAKLVKSLTILVSDSTLDANYLTVFGEAE